MSYLHRAFLLASVISLAALTGCGDDTSGSGGSGSGGGSTTQSSSSGTATGFLEATITGSPTSKTSMSITTLPGAYAEYRDTANGERISVHGNIPGTSGDFMVGEQSLRIYLQPYDGPRTYTFGAADGAGAAYAELDDTHVFYCAYGGSYESHGSGSITISDRTATHLIGTFSFTAEDDAQAASVSIDGSFDLPLQPDNG